MASPRSQFIVVSNDTEVLQACRAVAEQTDQLAPARQVLKPDLLPNALGLNDWVVLDLDYTDHLESWCQNHLASLAAQVVLTSGKPRQSDGESRWPSAGRFLAKDDLEFKLAQFFTEPGRASGPGQAPGPNTRDTGPAMSTALDDLASARQLSEFARRIAVLDRGRIVDACLEQLSCWSQARLVSLYALDDQQEYLELLGKTHSHPIDQQIRLDQNEQRPIVRTVRSRQAILAGTRTETAVLLRQDVQQPEGQTYPTETGIIAPIAAGNSVIGVVNLGDPTHPCGFNAQFVALIEPICDLIGVALNNARVFQEVRQQARTDGLTGLANRRAFVGQLNREVMRSRRYETALSLAMIDMDDLKEVNDLYGHLAGDAALQEAAERIRSTIRKIDMAARYGGDEFGIILPNTDLAQAQRVADRLTVAMVERPCFWQGNEFGITCSIGVCRYQGESTATALIEAADAALYAAKSQGKSCVAAAH